MGTIEVDHMEELTYKHLNRSSRALTVEKSVAKYDHCFIPASINYSAYLHSTNTVIRARKVSDRCL